MSFTYEDSLSADRDKIRFYIGDTTYESGPKPAGENFTDEELAGLVTLEGNWQRAIAACFEALASNWAQHPNFSADGVSVSQSDTAKHYREKAAEWRRTAGSGALMVGGVASVTRIDGYSYDVTNEDVGEDDAYASADYLLD